MSLLEALILGIVQGLTEFLPVSSSGHLEIGRSILGLSGEEDITFTIIVHGATILSIIVVFRSYIAQLIKGLLHFKLNEETHYTGKIVLSMIPAVFIGLLFEDKIESLFTGDLRLVGSMLLITATLLAFTFFAKARKKGVSYRNAFIIGIAQAFAILPGISRSGATIATGLLLGTKREETATFSFLMVVPVVIGANAKKIIDLSSATTIEANVSFLPLIVGFMAAFVSGLIACKWMLEIIKRGKLIYFAIYCFIIGITAIGYTFF